MTPATYALRTAHLTKSYFGNRVVRDVSLGVHSGEIYGLVGPNGAGKSTLMKLTCGFVLPTEGAIEVLGRRCGRGECPTGVGSLIEQPGLYGGMTLYDNLLCRAYAMGLPHPAKEVNRVLEAVGLTHQWDDRASACSVGVRQRTGVALALLGTPDLLILDEPFNGIDPKGCRVLRDILVDLNARCGVTIVVSSHMIDRLARLATRYGVMRKGRIVAEKTRDEVLNACAEYISVRSDCPDRALAVLREAFAPVEPVLGDGGEIRMPLMVGSNEIARVLVEAGVPIEELTTRRAEAEGYLASLMEESGDGHGE